MWMRRIFYCNGCRAWIGILSEVLICRLLISYSDIDERYWPIGKRLSVNLLVVINSVSLNFTHTLTRQIFLWLDSNENSSFKIYFRNEKCPIVTNSRCQCSCVSQAIIYNDFLKKHNNEAQNILVVKVTGTCYLILLVDNALVHYE